MTDGSDGVVFEARVILRLSHSKTPQSVPCSREADRTPGRTPPASGMPGT